MQSINGVQVQDIQARTMQKFIQRNKIGKLTNGRGGYLRKKKMAEAIVVAALQAKSLAYKKEMKKALTKGSWCLNYVRNYASFVF